MKVGTDGVLLGAWAQVGNARRILDIGTGTGLIALMIAQRSEAEIDAIEVDQDAAKQASENVQLSPWKGRVHIHKVSLQEFVKRVRNYDLIVTNPPFFANALKASDERRSVARHNQSLNYSDLMHAVMQMLDSRGRFCVILPPEVFQQFNDLMNSVEFFPARQTHVYSKPTLPCIRILAEFSKENSLPEINQLIIETNERHNYSSQFINLVKDYYLKL